MIRAVIRNEKGELLQVIECETKNQLSKAIAALWLPYINQGDVIKII